jgi:hypothetical protein
MNSYKTCNTCSTSKPVDEFPHDKRKTQGCASKCKSCTSLYRKQWFTTPKGWASAVYTNQINNSKRRGHSLPTYTTGELLLWAESNNLVSLMNAWALSHYSLEKRPSVDRLNENLGYSLSNIRLVTWQENHERNSFEVFHGKPTPRTRRCRQLTLDGQVVAEYFNVSEAARQNGLRRSAISNVCNGRKHKTGGFQWEHIN